MAPHAAHDGRIEDGKPKATVRVASRIATKDYDPQTPQAYTVHENAIRSINTVLYESVSALDFPRESLASKASEDTRHASEITRYL